MVRQTTPVTIALTCHEDPRTGSALVNGVLSICPSLDSLNANPAEVLLGSSIVVSGSWVTKGTVGAAADSYRGLTATLNSGAVTLYATRKGGSAAAGGGELVSLVDASGYNGILPARPRCWSVQLRIRGVPLALAPAP